MMLRREFFAKLGLGVLGIAVAPLVMLGPIRAVVSSDPDVEFEIVKRRHVFGWVRRDICLRCGHTREHIVNFEKRWCSGVWGQRDVRFIMNFGDSA